MAIYQGNKRIAGAGAGSYRNIGEIVPSLIPLSDAGLHLLDGAQISGTGVYAEFFNYIGTLVSAYPNLFCTEAQWQTSVSAYGVCGKFVYDSINNRLRFPKITGIIEGTTDTTALGDLVEAGLPNILGNIQNDRIYSAGLSGAFRNTSSTPYVFNYQNGLTANSYGISIDASAYNPIYKNNFNKVQPQTIKAYYYIVVANSTKLSIQANLDGIASDLNLKAGTDFANVTDTGTSLVASWSSPSSQYVGLAIGANGASYTAPSDGFVFLGYNIMSSAIGYVTIAQDGMADQRVYYGAAYNAVYIMRPVHKGIFTIGYGNASFFEFRFYYLEGNKHEAN